VLAWLRQCFGTVAPCLWARSCRPFRLLDLSFPRAVFGGLFSFLFSQTF